MSISVRDFDRRNLKVTEYNVTYNGSPLRLKTGLFLCSHVKKNEYKFKDLSNTTNQLIDISNHMGYKWPYPIKSLILDKCFIQELPGPQGDMCHASYCILDIKVLGVSSCCHEINHKVKINKFVNFWDTIKLVRHLGSGSGIFSQDITNHIIKYMIWLHKDVIT